MDKIFITGCGLTTYCINHFSDLAIKNIDKFSFFSLDQLDKIYAENRKFKMKGLLAREDRSLLCDDAQLALEVAMEAFEIAEKESKFSQDEKNTFPVFMVNETAPYKFDDLEGFANINRESNGNLSEESWWSNLGRLKEIFNPLDILRSLSTNPLYHVSKLFCLHGGGYPIRRASLSSLCAIEDAYYRLNISEQRALVVAVGNLTIPERYAPFERMRLVKSKDGQTGIVPSYGAASIILERDSNKVQNKKHLGELIGCYSIFKPNNQITEDDWVNLFGRFNRLKKINLEDLTVISYDNGNEELSESEQEAIYNYFPNSEKINYKKYIGYTGRANNLIDVVLALSDKRINHGRYVLINGVGNCMGLGCILIRKL